MFCPNCGKEIEGSSRFCRFCGKAIEAGSSMPASGEGAVKRQGWTFSWGVVLATCGICLLGVGAYFGSVRSSKSGDEESPAEEVLKELEEERPRIAEGSTKHLPEPYSPQRITTEIVTTGKGENAKWGLKTSGSFQLIYRFVCDSEILEKSESSAGEIKVVERRKFTEIKQELKVSDVDAGFAFHECLPMKGILSLFTCFDPTGATAASVEVGARALEGKSVRGVLGMFGIGLEQKYEDKINEFLNSHLKSFFKETDMKGRTYVLTYIQDAGDGKPSMMKVVREDGSLLTEEERLVLRRANVFMDTQMVPDSNCSPGDCWKVNSGDFSCLLDPFVEGKYDGEVAVRRADDEDGLWKLKLEPATIAVKADNGTTSGSVDIADGVAHYDDATHTVCAMQIGGKGNLKNLTRHHFLFSARLEGQCNFSAILKTEPKK